MLGDVKVARGLWSNPIFTKPIYPVLDIATIELIEKKKKEKRKTVSEHISLILEIESTLIDHIENIEKYYIETSKDLDKILLGIKMFIRNS
jgi:hypothetical protein